MKKLLVLAVSLFFVIMSGSAFAQNADIEIKDLVIENNQLVIYYDILKAKKKETFEVWPEITTSNGQKINASAFSGDYGEGIVAGTDKKIIWDYNADGVILNDKVYVELKAKIALYKTDIGLGKALLLSAVVPGLGINKTKGGGMYWLMSIPVYGLATGAFFNHNQAKDKYDQYVNSEFQNPSEADNLYRDAEDYQSTSQTLTYSAIGLWAVNMIWTGIVAKKNSSLSAYYNKKKTFFYTRLNPATKTVGFTLKYRF